MIRRLGVIRKMTRTNKGKDDREEHEAMEESEHHNQEKHFEEYHEGVVV